jgi:hypothetical protein
MATGRTPGAGTAVTWFFFLIAALAIVAAMVWRSPWFHSLMQRFDFVR